MDISNMRNMVVLKNLPSNIVDEAIVILKTNKKIKRPEMAENIVNNSKTSWAPYKDRIFNVQILSGITI